MRVTVLGAGPGGLYFAALLKKADPAHEVTVLERNAPDSTFGWGVVFSEETLGALRDADQATYLEITDTFARWDAIDIRYRDRLLRSRGHAFSAIARTQLLAILQRRCHALGVDLRFHTEVTDPAELDADLVVAADGVNSLLRRRGDFGSSVTPQGCKYIWFGTDLVLDAFTFLFRETEFGLFQVHAYPFDENASTFIVECPEPVWRRAGLDEASERDSIEFCSTLFAEDLRGHRLLSNKSSWLSFQRVRNRQWHDGRTVLLGDAAHTAHFTIGSGTKLAMEDAIALAGALTTRDTVEAALTDYELERQPVVERFQEAAAESARYFEHVGDHAGLEPAQFAFNLLTRSGRISHANLSVRDAEFVRSLDSWFATGGARTTAIAPPPMFAPLRLGDAVLRNRVVVVADRDGVAEAAASGAGLVLTELVAVEPRGRVTSSTPLLDDDWADAVRLCHNEGAALGLRLGHAGRRGSTRASGSRDVALPSGRGWPTVAASALPYAPLAPVPAELDRAGLERIAEAFTVAAGRAADAGADLLELDLAHGYLLAGFLSPLTNRRTDGYGGDLAARLRFPLEVLAGVRAVWPAERVLSVRLTVTDWARRGHTVAEGIAVAKAVAEAGAQLVHVQAGQTVADDRPEYRRGYLTALADRVRGEAGVPTMVGGYLTTHDEVNTIVAAGRADLCVLRLPQERKEVAG